MSDFNGNIFDMVGDISKQFDGKSSDELLKAIYKETLKGKKNGSLTNDDIDRFAKTLTPFLDEKKKRILDKVVEELKNI